MMASGAGKEALRLRRTSARLLSPICRRVDDVEIVGINPLISMASPPQAMQEECCNKAALQRKTPAEAGVD
jgi:hypothetical protein